MRSRAERVAAGWRRMALAPAVVLLCGCTIQLRDVPLAEPLQRRTDVVRAGASAEGISGKVGWGRLTVAWIPAIPIFIVDGTQPSATNTRAQIANREVMRQVRRALERVGYRIETIDPDDAGAGRVLTTQVNRFWFNNYTWVLPIVPTWGNVEITVSVTGPDGHEYWSQNFCAESFTMNFFDGYTRVANRAMEEVLNQMVKAFSRDRFQQAVAGG